jgi:hypothetical protein
MSKRTISGLLAVVICLSWGVALSKTSFAADTDITVEKLISEHLKSIGAQASVLGVKSRVLNGISTVQFIQGMKGNQRGEFLMASEPNKLGIIMKYSAVDYPQEYFTFDGTKVSVAYMSPGQRSPLADFIWRFNGPVKEGILGGALSVNWPLLDIQKKQATLKVKEVTIDDKKLYEVEYIPKKSFGGDVKVKLYFDPATYHHVRTEYSVYAKGDAAALPSVNASGPAEMDQNITRVQERAPRATIMENQADSRYKLVEKFDDFQKAGDLTLPYTYSIEYSVEGSGASFVGRWSNRAAGKFTNNAQIGPEFFQAQK